jgi:hypothetical protein
VNGLSWVSFVVDGDTDCGAFDVDVVVVLVRGVFEQVEHRVDPPGANPRPRRGFGCLH